MPVVYDGVNGKRGNLFEGIKLWISRHVPMRSRYVELVEGNGGEVVRLETNADMLIFDHKKKLGVSPPDGSYTWQWIHTSVENGFLQDKSDYVIRTEARLAGASKPAKSTRTAFTKTDDSILVRTVQANEETVEPKAIGELFQDLAKKNGRHTAQSWYDHWVKVVRPRLDSKIPEGGLDQVNAESRTSPEQAATADVPARTTESARQAQSNQEAGPSNGHPLPQHRAQNPSAPASRSRPAARGRNTFTDEDVRMLLSYVQEQTALGKPLSGNAIYKKFAQDHPTHSWHSWRDKSLKHLSSMDAVDDNGPLEQSKGAQDDSGGDGEPEPRLQVNVHASKSARPSVAGNPIAANGDIEVPGTAGAPSPSPSRPVSRQLNPKSDEERLKRREQEKTRTHAAKLLQRTWRGHAVRRDQAKLEAAFVPLQAMMRGYLVRLREVDRLTKAMEANMASGEADRVSSAENHDQAEEDSQGPAMGPDGMLQHDRDAREQFYDDLEAYIEVSGAKVVGKPLIDGRPIDLWDLFSLATQQDCQPEERDWAQVASELGFDPETSPALIEDMRECYHQNLAEFEETIRAYENDDGLEEGVEQPEEPACDETAQELVLTSDAVTAPKQPLADASFPPYHSSPPLAASKRSRQHTELLISDPGYPSDGSRKRRRLNKDVEIPPTPEEKLELPHSQLRRGAAHDKSSPLKSRGVPNGEAVAISSGEESDDFSDAGREDGERVDEFPDRGEPQKRRYIEPETQDWRFGMDNKQELLHSIEDDVSPSQQLQLESDAFKSPQRVVRRGQVTVKQNANRLSLATVDARAAGETYTRALGSEPKLAQVEAASARVSRAPVNGKTTKRVLPPEYHCKPDLAVPTIASVSTYNSARNATTQPRPGPRLSNSVRPTGTPPVRPTNSNASWDKPFTCTPTLGVLRSASKRAPTFPPSSSKLLNGSIATNIPVPEVTYDAAYFDAQIEHFQGLGYQEEHISKALHAATFQRGPMAVAIQSLAEGRGVPPDEAGIWTTSDDEDLRIVMKYDRRIKKGKYAADDAVERRTKVRVWTARSSLDLKHGEDRVKKRVEFMQLLEAREKGQQT